MEELVAMFAKVGESVGSAAEKAGEGLGQMQSGLGQMQSAVSKATGVFATLGQQVSGVISSVVDLPAQLVGALGDVIKAFTDVPGQLAAAIAGIGESLIGAIKAPFDQIASVIGPFVNALSPATMQQFQRAMADLSATIGVALQPIMQSMSGSLRELGGALLPIMERLAPLLSMATEALTDAVTPALETFADVANDLISVFEVTWQASKMVYEAMIPLWEVSRALYQSFASFIGGILGKTDWKDVLASFQSGLQKAVALLITSIAQVARAFGALGFIGNLASNLEEFGKPHGPGAKAAGPTSFKGFEDIGKTFALAAFNAQGGKKPEERQLDYLKDLADSLRKIEAKGTQPWDEVIVKAMDRWWETHKGTPPLSVIEAARRAIEHVETAVSRGLQNVENLLNRLPHFP